MFFNFILFNIVAPVARWLPPFQVVVVRNLVPKGENLETRLWSYGPHVAGALSTRPSWHGQFNGIAVFVHSLTCCICNNKQKKTSD